MRCGLDLSACEISFSCKFRKSGRAIAMRLSLRGRMAGAVPTAWLLAVLVSAVLPAQARAGCNHPWLKSSGFSPALVELKLINASGDPSLTPSGSRDRPNRPGPCAGVACGRVPDLPASSSPSISDEGKIWGDLPKEPPPLDSGSCARYPDGRLQRPAAPCTSIERPPRATS